MQNLNWIFIPIFIEWVKDNNIRYSSCSDLRHRGIQSFLPEDEGFLPEGDRHTRQPKMERIMFVFFWSESPSLYMCIQPLWKCDSSYAGYCTNRTGSHASHQIGVGIEFLSLLLWDCELTWPCLHSCKAGVIPLLFFSWAESSFCIFLVSAILCFFVSTSLDTSNKISLWWKKMPLDRACLTGQSLDYRRLMRLLRSLTHWGKNLTKTALLSCNCCGTTSHFGHQICRYASIAV